MSGRDVQRFSIYLPIAMYEQLRKIAFEERTSINQLVLDAVEQALAKRSRGKPKTTKKGG
jgi:metal-responsive CopG/Arc/MetJ family transcriptional regulator